MLTKVLVHGDRPSAKLQNQHFTHRPQAGGDLELVQCREPPMPKAAPKWAAAPNTLPAINSKPPMAVPTSSIPTTSLPNEITEAAVTVPDDGGPKQSVADAITIDKWRRPIEFRSWRMSFTGDVSHSSQYPKAATLWIGEVEDAKSIDNAITSASFTGRPNA